MNLEILARYAPLYVDAAILTLRIAAIGIVGSLAVGLLVAAIRHYRIPIASQIGAAYVELSRNTPLLVQLFFIYFGLPRVGIKWSGETCAIVGLIFLGGAYMAEALRSGLDSIATIQWESASALGLTRTQTLRHVALPQAIATSVPPLEVAMACGRASRPPCRRWPPTSSSSLRKLPSFPSSRCPTSCTSRKTSSVCPTTPQRRWSCWSSPTW